MNISREELQQKLSPKQHYEQGLKLLRSNAYDRALKAFELALEGEPGDVRYQAHQAWVSFLINPERNWRKSQDALTECVKSQEDTESPAVEPYLFLARLYKRRGDQKMAQRLFRGVLRIEPNNIEAQRERRLAQMRKTGDGEAGDGSFFGKLFQKKKP